MKKIIEGKLYNTDTAKQIAVYDNKRLYNDFYYIEESLHRKKNGEYFIYGYGGAGTCYAVESGSNHWTSGERIMPVSYAEAKEWMETNAGADEYEAEFGEASEDDNTVTMCISLPASTADRLRKLAGEAGIPVSRYIAKCVENR